LGCSYNILDVGDRKTVSDVNEGQWRFNFCTPRKSTLEGFRARKNNAVRPITALRHFDMNFRTPAQKGFFKRLFEKAFPL
jgi:hypothetical protein